MKRLRTGLAIGILVLMAGCAGTVKVLDHMGGVGVIKEEVQTFDNSTSITLSPAHLSKPGGGITPNAFRLGARWSSEHPDSVTLVALYSSLSNAGMAFTNFQELDVRIADETESFKSAGFTNHKTGQYNTVSRSIDSRSEGLFVVPLSLVREMVNAEDVRLRIATGDGYEDSVFSMRANGAGQVLAIQYFEDFLKRVDAARSRLASEKS